MGVLFNSDDHYWIILIIFIHRYSGSSQSVEVATQHPKRDVLKHFKMGCFLFILCIFISMGLFSQPSGGYDQKNLDWCDALVCFSGSVLRLAV